MTDWQNVPLGSLLEAPVRAGIYVPKSQRGRGVPLINMGELFAHDRIGAPPMERVPIPVRNDGKYLVRAGDVLMARLSLKLDGVGKVALVDDASTDRTWDGSIFRLRFHPDRADPRYFYYYFRSHWGRVQLLSLVQQTAAAGIRGTDLARMEVPAPPLRVQRVIADTLSAHDDKIELNRRMSETLEAMARALFKSWFVDFDPVRAKSEGRATGTSGAVADVLPDGFDDSELGPIPRGWRLTSIGDVADVIDCLHSRKPERRDVGRPLLQLLNIRDDGLIDLADPYLIDESDYFVWTSRMEARPGDCVITNVGRAGAVAQIPEGTSAALGRNMTGIRCKAEFPYPTFLLECLLSDAMGSEIDRRIDTGTILDALNVRSIPKLRFVMPTAEIASMFERIARPIRRRMELNLAHSQTLAATRDALLPKLLSGEIRVPHAKRVLEAAPA